ncbi:hypothetical protein [Azotobacter chroococcum]|uniref:hypothetical protein n=1 Tax=Azotobacter chroococcum TaxID=353 RepID=UPI000691E92A|nr:hypothetical protein [Azotobacter chroococcum]
MPRFMLRMKPRLAERRTSWIRPWRASRSMAWTSRGSGLASSSTTIWWRRAIVAPVAQQAVEALQGGFGTLEYRDEDVHRLRGWILRARSGRAEGRLDGKRAADELAAVVEAGPQHPGRLRQADQDGAVGIGETGLGEQWARTVCYAFEAKLIGCHLEAGGAFRVFRVDGPAGDNVASGIVVDNADRSCSPRVCGEDLQHLPEFGRIADVDQLRMDLHGDLRVGVVRSASAPVQAAQGRIGGKTLQGCAEERFGRFGALGAADEQGSEVGPARQALARPGQVQEGIGRSAFTQGNDAQPDQRLAAVGRCLHC